MSKKKIQLNISKDELRKKLGIVEPKKGLSKFDVVGILQDNKTALKPSEADLVDIVTPLIPKPKKGDDGDDGSAPEHRWKGTKLQFKNPDGTWGEEVDLLGENGEVDMEQFRFMARSGGKVGSKDEGVTVKNSTGFFNFIGDDVTVTENGKGVDVTIDAEKPFFPTPLDANDCIEDEGEASIHFDGGDGDAKHQATWGQIDGTLADQTDLTLQTVTDNGAVTTNKVTITDEGIDTDYVDLDLTPLSTIQEGRMQWDADENTAVIGMNGGEVNLQVGQESLVHVINKSGADIANGNLVYSTGSQGNKLTIDLADNTDSDKIHILGMATEDIANNATGYVSTFGKVRGTGAQPIDTSSFVEGDKLYLNSAGGWTKTHPAGATDAVIIFGHVLRVHATTGIIQMANPESFTIGNNFNGILRQSVINQNTGANASSAFTAVNDASHRASLSMVGSGYTAVAGIAEALVLYNQGYNKTVNAVDGNFGFEWWTDVTDSHNLSSTSKMSLSADGSLTLSGRHIRSKSVYTGTDTTDDVSVHVCDSASAFTLTVTDGADDGEEIKIINRGVGTITLSGKISLVTADTTLLTGETVVLNWDVTDDEWQ